MCGLFAFFSTGDQRLTPEALERALDAQAHRGPDGRGRWISPGGGVALGHVRLAVIAEDDGAQPLFSEDGAIVAVVNGEFYGFEAARRALTARGHRFQTGSDSEILVHLYEEQGPECLQELRGEFAFVLWDGRRRRIFAARDRFGVKPLSYARTDGGLFFASQARGLFAAGVAAGWDKEAFLHAMHHQYLPPGRSLFAGVQTVRPGRFLVGAPGALREEIYWDIEFPREERNRTPVDSREAMEELRRRFEEAVASRLRSDVPLAVCLSGGLDSSAVAAVAAVRSAAPLTCFGVRFDAEGYDEGQHALEVAESLGAAYRPVEVSQRAMLEGLAEAVGKAEGLGINGHIAAKSLLSRAIREAGFKVVLTGEGADEALGGYAHFLHDLEGPAAPDHKSAAICRGVMLPRGQGLSTAAVAKRLGSVPTFLLAKAGIGRQVAALLHPALRERAASRDYLDGLLDSFDLPGRVLGRHPVDRSAYLWSRLALSGYILQTLGDGTEMAHGVEGRTPFLDHRFFEYAQALPVSLKIRDGLEKWVFREAMKGLLPKSTLARRKQPFLAPPLRLLDGEEGRHYVGDHLSERALRESGLFDARRVRALLERLSVMEDGERQAAEPVVMTILTAMLLGDALKLESP